MQEEVVATQILISTCKALIPFIINKLSGMITAQKQDSEKVSEAIGVHLTEVVNWASNIQFVGMNVPQSTADATVALNIDTESRRFKSVVGRGKSIAEKELLSGPHHILLLGDPGSGKTTTIKRIALAMLTESPPDDIDRLQYPIVIRLRELSEGESLLAKIAAVFGLSIEPHEITVYEDTYDSYGKPIKIPTKRTEMRIGNEKVENVIPKFLSNGQALLLLDGLDELRLEHRSRIRGEIVNLGLRQATSKTIVSCRSGDYTQQMDGFAVHEICPLSNSQILSIKNKWLGPEDTGFMKCLQSLPYFDVADRPLLLTQLLFIYKRYGYLPEQPSSVYQKLINILLEEWDSERGIRRDTKYAGFNPQKKADFLASLAYRITYSLRSISFTEDDLVRAYCEICKRFNLPSDEATQVAREIQTHTGIILLGTKDVYEFCHLSLQEYLCAEYIVRSPLEPQATRYLAKYPAPLAIAVALSSSPSDWFGNLILKFGNLKDFNAESMASFLNRVLIERPSFHASETLGFAMLTLFKHYSNDSQVCKYLEELLGISCVDESIAKSLKWYDRKHSHQVSTPFVEVSLNQSLEKVYDFKLPSDGMFPLRILQHLQKLARDRLFSSDQSRA